MSRVKIVGGGLTGILAAFQAHRLGVRDIQLHERFDRLGGVALPDERDGLELREGCIYFGPQGDPIRELLESYGPTFQDIDNRFGSVSPTPDGELRYIEDFGGPALACQRIGLSRPTGSSLADRLAAYPPELRAPLVQYARWHLGHDLKDVHESAAIPMAINRVFPVGSNLADLAEIKRHDPLADALANPTQRVLRPVAAGEQDQAFRARHQGLEREFGPPLLGADLTGGGRIEERDRGATGWLRRGPSK